MTCRERMMTISRIFSIAFPECRLPTKRLKEPRHLQAYYHHEVREDSSHPHHLGTLKKPRRNRCEVDPSSMGNHMKGNIMGSSSNRLSNLNHTPKALKARREILFRKARLVVSLVHTRPVLLIALSTTNAAKATLTGTSITRSRNIMTIMGSFGNRPTTSWDRKMPAEETFTNSQHNRMHSVMYRTNVCMAPHLLPRRASRRGIISLGNNTNPKSQ